MEKNHFILNKPRFVRTAILLFFSLLSVVFVLWNATRTAEESSALSDKVSNSIKDSIEDSNTVPPLLQGTEVIRSEAPNAEGSGKVSVNLYQLKIFIRKSGHLIEYTLLTFFVSLTIVSHFGKKDLAFLWSILIGIAVASSDEIIQSHTSGRSGKYMDVLIDLCGCIMGIFFALCVVLTLYYCITGTKKED